MLARVGMPQPIQLLRIAGIMAVSLSALESIPGHLGSGSGANVFSLAGNLLQHRLPDNVFAILELLAYLMWGAAFWRATRADEISSPRRFSVILLGVQTVIAVLFSTELLYLGAAEVAFLVPFRAGIVWILCQSAAELISYIGEPRIVGAFQPSTVTSLPPLAQFTILALESLTYHFLSYSLGLLGGMESRQRRELMHANAELRAMQQIEADSARLAERLTIARELHDSMGHHLTGLSVNLQLATRVGPEKARQAIDEAYMLSRLLLSDVRTVVTDLRDLHAVRLAEALRTLGANVQTPVIHLDIDPAMEDGLPPLVSHALFRCVQEIVTNTIRHSGARNLWIKLLSVGRRYELHSRDDGHGVAHLVWGNGLTGMRERVEELGGSMTLTTRAGAGFAVTVALPETEVS